MQLQGHNFSLNVLSASKETTQTQVLLLCVQRWAKRWAQGCKKFLTGPAWLLLSRTGPPFSTSL